MIMKLMNSIKQKCAVIFFLIIIGFIGGSFKNPERWAGMAFASYCTPEDSVSFKPDTKEGWGCLQTYLNRTKDSVEFELILTRTFRERVDWERPLFIGTIAAEFAPDDRVELDYKEPTRRWSIMIFPKGQCYLRLLKGPVPDGNPCVIPFQTRYKK